MNDPTEKQIEEGYTLILTILKWRRSFLETNLLALEKNGQKESVAYADFERKWKALVELSKNLF